MAALRTDRDRAMAQAMLLGGLRRGEVLGLRLEDLRLGEWRVFIAEGKGGHQRLVPISPTFFATVADYMNKERPPDASTDRLFVSLKGPRRGQPLSAEGIIEIFSAARERAGLAHGTCHELATPASPDCAKPAWPSRPSRPRPVTAPSRRRGSTYTSASTGSPRSIARPWSPSAHRWRWPDERPPEGSTHPLAVVVSDRVPLGRDGTHGTSDGGHHGPLPGPTGRVGSSDDRRRHRARAAPLRRTGHASRSRVHVDGGGRAPSRRGPQALAGRSAGQGRQTTRHGHHPAPARVAAHLLRAAARLGLRRRTQPNVDLPR